MKVYRYIGRKGTVLVVSNSKAAAKELEIAEVLDMSGYRRVELAKDFVYNEDADAVVNVYSGNQYIQFTKVD
jgi:hypothetical protein